MSPASWGETVSSYLTIHLGRITLSPTQTLIVALALAAASLAGYHLWRIGRREDRQTRLESLSTAFDAAQVRTQRSPWYRRLGGAVAASPIIGASEQHRLLRLLASAGIKEHGSLASFVATKLCGALATTALIWLVLTWTHWFATIATVRLALIVGGLMLGWRLPELFLSRLAARRRRHIELGIPDALDLLVICAEAGLSLNQAIEEIARDLRPSNPYVAAEFAATAVELRVLPDIGEALDNLVQRAGLPTLRSIIATLKQSMRFGTPLAESMRMLAAEMRQTRQARMEERAARLPVLLAIPMMLFILPCLMMVIGTPLALRIMDTFRNTFGIQ